MKVIVSSRFAVEVVDVNTGERELIRTSDYDTLYYGITWVGQTMFLGKRYLNENRTVLEILDKDLDYVDSIGCPEVKDIHQILFHDDVLWLTSCGTNSIVKMSPGGQIIGHWYPNEDHKGTDKNHFNSIWFGQSAVYVVAHNGGSSQLYSFTYPELELVSVKDVGMGAHNIYVQKDEAILLSSGDGYALSASPRVYNLFRNSYPRGLAVAGNAMVVGLSEHVTDRGIRHKERRGAVQKYLGVFGRHEHILTHELGHGMIWEIRGLDFHDRAHNGSVWTGKHGVIR